MKVFEDLNLEELRKYIDWTPFFISWQLKGKYPDILKDDKYGEQATELYKDANKMLDDIISEKWIKANAVIGIFPANSNMDDIEIYTDESRSKLKLTMHQLRQQSKKANGKPNYCLADFVGPKSMNIKDHVGAFAVTAGLGIENKIKEFEDIQDDYQFIRIEVLDRVLH